ncbi:MAG: hypothetical protein HY270_05480 [Deltaproteobacteria bacterium]|nr:hypothetical protein [Deltaproteobacteria bacterium]
MRTVKWNPFLSGVCALLGGVAGIAGVARADVSSTNPAAIVVFPKVLVDVTRASGDYIDTIIQLSNTADNPVNVRCFYVNANGHCSNAPFAICDPYNHEDPTECGSTAFCVPGWQETDFAFRLTSKQPIAWTVSDGQVLGVKDNSGNPILGELPLANRPGRTGEFNSGSIPPAPETPMRGELKCIQVGDDELPVDANSLKGEATIETVDTGVIDARGYNAVGIQAIEGANNHDNTLVLGAEYNGCPNLLVIDHFFDDATEPTSNQDTVTSKLTLVPCSEDFNFQAPRPVTVQYLVFNEFEQRFSTSRSVTCFQEIALSDIDTRLGSSDDQFSIFNVNVQGTLTGQTTARGVQTSDNTSGTGLIAVLEEFRDNFWSNAVTTHQRGIRTQNDIILLPAAQPGN